MRTSWLQVPLGDLLVERKVRIGVFDADGLPLLGVSNFGGLHRTEKARIADMSRYLRVNRRWFAYNPMRINVGSIGWAERPDQTGVVSPDYVVFSCTDRIEPKLLYLFLRSAIGLRAINLETAGSVRERLYFDSLSRIRFPLPPLPEQRRIVARIEELAAKINEARGLRRKGMKEAEALIGAYLRVAYCEQANRYGFTRLDHLIAEAGYGTSEKCSSERNEGAVPVLRIPNVASERIDLNDLKFALLGARDRERLDLANGDLLVVRTNGSLDLVGRSAVIDDLPEPMAFASYMIRLRVDSSRILPTYAQRMLRHLRTSGQLIDFARTTAGQYNVSLGRLRAAEIPVPPLSQQQHLVAELDAVETRVDALNKLQAENASELDALLPSILDRAFNRKL